MCYTLCLTSTQALEPISNDSYYPELEIRDINDPEMLLRSIVPKHLFVYDVCPQGLCGCYFQYDSAEALQEKIVELLEYRQGTTTAAMHMFPEVTLEQAERLMWNKKRDAVNSFGHYLQDLLETKTVELELMIFFEGDQRKSFVDAGPITAEAFLATSCDLLESLQKYRIARA